MTPDGPLTKARSRHHHKCDHCPPPEPQRGQPTPPHRCDYCLRWWLWLPTINRWTPRYLAQGPTR